MTGYLAALAALAVDAAPRLRPRTVGRFEPEQPESGGGFEAFDVEREVPAPPRPATRSAAPATPGAAPAPAAVPTAVAPLPVATAPAPDPDRLPAPAAARTTPPAPVAARLPEPAPEPAPTTTSHEQAVRRATGPVDPGRPAPPPRPAPSPAPPDPPTASAARPATVSPVVPAVVVRPAPPTPPARAVPVTRAAARAPERPTVHLHIGRIDVRLAPGQRSASAAPAPVAPVASVPAVDPGPAPELEAYLRAPERQPR